MTATTSQINKGPLLPLRCDGKNHPTRRRQVPAWAAVRWALFLVSLLSMGCANVDIGGPRAKKDAANTGILEPSEGRPVPVLPSLLNYTGPGTYTYPDGRAQSGHWVAGKLQGMGSEITDTETYSGQWRDGKRHGHGEVQRKDGSRYVGDFVAGLAEGKGTESSKAGVYRGTWYQGKRHGQGQFNASDGAIYQGQWQGGQRAGFGQATFINSDEYSGEWLEDHPNGFGVMQYANAGRYEGSWIAGQRQGYGTFIDASDVVYEGTWQADQRHGFGRESRPDGVSYAGQWQFDQKHGDGVETHANNTSHTGVWVKDRISGTGTRINRARIRISGDWQDNDVSTGAIKLPDGHEYSGAMFANNRRKVEPDLLTWMENRARSGSAYAQYFLGVALLDFDQPAPDPVAAKVRLIQAAEAGIAEAQYRLALLVEQDNAMNAVAWLKLAATQSHPLAHEVLGGLYHHGQYVAQDYAQAITHYEGAAALGSMPGTNGLAWLLATAAQAEYRDPRRALELIQPLVLFFGHWRYLDTLAAAHAQLGDTTRAVRIQQQAIAQARAKGKADALRIAQMTVRLKRYQDGQAHTE